MKSPNTCLTIFVVGLVTFAFVLSASGQSCFLFPRRQNSVAVDRSHLSPAPAFVATPAVSNPAYVPPTIDSGISSSVLVQRPIILSQPVSTSLPVLVGPPMRESVLNYDVPILGSTSSSTITTIHERPWAETGPVERIVSYEDFSTSGTISPEMPIISRVARPESERMSSVYSEQWTLLPLRQVTSVAEEPVVTVEEVRPARTSPPAPTNQAMTGPSADESTSSLKTEAEKTDEIATVLDEPFSEITFPREERSVAMKPPMPAGEKEPESAKAWETPPIVRGQDISDIRRILEERPPLARGTVEPEEIHEDLKTSVPLPFDDVEDAKKETPNETDKSQSAAAKTSGNTNGYLLLTAIIATMVSVYLVVLAFDYRQRWMQSLTSQNNRFSMPYDDELYGLDYTGPSEPSYLSGSLGLGRFGSDYLESVSRY